VVDVKSKRITAFVFIFSFVTAYLLNVPVVSAALTGIELSPVTKEIVLQPEDTQKTLSVLIKNRTRLTKQLDITARDFGSLNETGGVLFTGSTGYTEKYGLASWLTLETSSIVLEPGAERKVLVTVDNRESLGPGGHYGAILVSVNDKDSSSGNQVAVQQEISSLVFVNKTGGAKFDLKLDSFSLNSSAFRLPNTVKLRFHNPGNVHVVPRGTAQLKNASGKIVAQGIINEESAYILPESYRQLITELRPVGRPLNLPGKYHLEVAYRYDGLSAVAVRSRPITYGLPLLILVPLIGLTFIYQKRKTLKNKPADIITKSKS